MLISLIKRYRYIKKLDNLIFPDKPIPIKIVWKGRQPAGYWNVQGKSKKEWYEVSFVAIPGNEFNIAVHEVRHRVQFHNPDMPLFTRDKLKMQRRNPAIQQIIEELEAIEKKEQKPLSKIEQDAIIVARITTKKCQGICDPVKTASQWIKKTP